MELLQLSNKLLIFATKRNRGMINDKQIRKMIGDSVHTTDPSAEVILFGSRARGDARADSDWDVLIIVNTPKVTDKQFETLNYQLWLKGLEFGQEINPIIYTRTQWEDSNPSLFKYNIREEGIRL